MKNKLKATMVALTTLLCLPLMAQTDVTSKYIQNADFSTGWATADIGNNTVATVDGWQGATTKTDWSYGGAIGYNTGVKVNGSNPGVNPDGGTSGGALGLSAGWECTIQYTQLVNLPAGVYTLEYTYYNTCSATQATNLFGYIDKDGGTHYGSSNSFVSGQWTTESVNFIVPETSTGKISVGIGAISGGSGANAKLFVDHVRLLKSEDANGAVNTDKGSWGGSGIYPNDGSSLDGVIGAEVFQWAASLPLGVRMSQDVVLPDGKYRVEVYAMASSTSGRDNTSNVITDGSTEYISLHAGDQSIGIPAYNRTAFDKFDAYTFECVDVNNGVLTISLNEDKQGPNWLVMQIKDLVYLGRDKLGDVNMSGETDVADVTELVNIILGKSTDKYNTGNINQTGAIDVADVTELVNIILGKTVVPQNVKITGSLHAQQDGSDVVSVTEMLDDDTADPLASYDMQSQLTRVAVSVSLSNIASVNIYSKDHSVLAGDFKYFSRRRRSCTTSGSELTYASTSASDVVSVTQGSNGVYTAYLLPGKLANGITVTVRTTDGKFYSQDFSGIVSGQVNNITFTQTSADNLWMSTIPGSTYFSFISTPGAHDAATSGCTQYTYLSKCQKDDLSTLLANGVRQFDLRPGYYYSETITENNLYIYHGQVSTNVLYKDAIKILCDFLEAHPSEAISVIMVKENSKPTLSSWTDRSSEMWSVINSVHSTYSKYMKVLDHSYYTLDDFRGKICYINRTGTECTNTTRITNWPDDTSVTNYSCAIGGTCYANVEDAYTYSSDDSKKSAITTMIDLCSANTEKKNFHYTYTSIAGSATSNLTKHANTMNPYTATYIESVNGPVGYILADYMGNTSYGGSTLLKAVVDQNYKYVFQGR